MLLYDSHQMFVTSVQFELPLKAGMYSGLQWEIISQNACR